jgi:hypothetical protein
MEYWNKVGNLSLVFHRRSSTLLDTVIQWAMPKRYRRPYLHVSFGKMHENGDWGYYTWTWRGLEVLDIQKSDVYAFLVSTDFSDDLLDEIGRRALYRCQCKVKAFPLLLHRMGLREHVYSCASLVGYAVFDQELLIYPQQVWEYAVNEGFKVCWS